VGLHWHRHHCWQTIHTVITNTVITNTVITNAVITNAVVSNAVNPYLTRILYLAGRLSTVVITDMVITNVVITDHHITDLAGRLSTLSMRSPPVPLLRSEIARLRLVAIGEAEGDAPKVQS
jgi:hypothetical protein